MLSIKNIEYICLSSLIVVSCFLGFSKFYLLFYNQNGINTDGLSTLFFAALYGGVGAFLLSIPMIIIWFGLKFSKLNLFFRVLISFVLLFSLVLIDVNSLSGNENKSSSVEIKEYKKVNVCDKKPTISKDIKSWSLECE